jgi:hypothetical protein
MQGLLVGFHLCIQAVNWIYGQHLMDEWNLTRWHARARLHFLGKVATYSGPNLLGGAEVLIEQRARILERLGMLQPPRAADLGSRLWAEKSYLRVRKRGDSTG